MTVSYRPEQYPEPQQPLPRMTKPTEDTGPIRRKIVVRTPITPPSGVRFFAADQLRGSEKLPSLSQALSSDPPRQEDALDVAGRTTGALPTLPVTSVNGQPTQVGQHEPDVAQQSTALLPTTGQNGHSHAPTRAPGAKPIADQETARVATQIRQPSALRNSASNGVIASATASPSAFVENGAIILYRAHNFFVRIAYRPGYISNPLREPGGHTITMPRVMPNQNKRVEVSDTRVMPNIALNPGKQARAIPLPTWAEAIMVMLALLGTFAAHAYNMFNFPRYELDEGTYMSYAWAILHGMVASEPYGYGHPPLGWIQIAGWIQATGGFFTFGTAINSGRVLMLLYALGSALLVYLIVRRMSGSASAGLLALVIFSFSPLSITYQRQVFLDNIAVFWLLMSLYLLVAGKSRLKYIIGAALCFGIAFLSKETAAIFFPGIVYAAWLYSTKFQRKFSLTAFIYTIMAVCSTWVLMAILKGELFPYAWHLPWDTHPHLSMLDTFFGQAQRGVESGSLFSSFQIWQENDPIFMILSIAAPIFNLLHGWWNRKHLVLALLSALYWLLLVRGGQVLSFYVIMLIPVTAINTAMALNAMLSWAGKIGHWRALHIAFNITRAALLLVALAAILPYDIQETSFRFYQQPTSAQEQAMVWIRDHVSRDSFIVINSYLYLDLRLPGGTGVGDSAPFPHAEVYWEVAYDPVLHNNTLDNNPDRIDYIVADSEMLNDITTYGGPMDIIKQAYEHSVLLADFRADDHNSQIVIQIFQVIHKLPSPIVMNGQPSSLTTQATASTMQANEPIRSLFDVEQRRTIT